ncbi:hypothetical protein FACS1894167_14620 [Synergistales bacterium]|nr:hypothetical protein FACS1894167_14620 [Synergistales bacterium]GHV52093.1 hypothetical protein FACS1894216_07610 [Synergistales bacterium]
MSCNSTKSFARFVSLLVFAFVMAVFAQAAFAADQTHTTKNGVSFKYPAGWMANEVQQGQITSVNLINPSAPTASVALTVTEGVKEKLVPQDEAALKSQLASAGQNVKLVSFKKVKIAGKDATLYEYSMEPNGVFMQTRTLMFQDGARVITVASVYSDKTKIAEGQKASAAIENSITVK